MSDSTNALSGATADEILVGDTTLETPIIDAPEGEGAEAQAEPEPKVERFAKTASARIAELTRQRHEAERGAARDREELAAMRAKFTPEDVQKTPQNDLNAMAERRALQIIEQRETAAKMSAWDTAGKAEFPDFLDRCATVAALGATERPEFMQIVTDMEDGHKVVAALADDPDLASRIIALPPHKMALELAKLSAPAPKRAAPQSKAPAPPRTVDGRALSSASLTDYGTMTPAQAVAAHNRSLGR